MLYVLPFGKSVSFRGSILFILTRRALIQHDLGAGPIAFRLVFIPKVLIDLFTFFIANGSFILSFLLTLSSEPKQSQSEISFPTLALGRKERSSIPNSYCKVHIFNMQLASKLTRIRFIGFVFGSKSKAS